MSETMIKCPECEAEFELSEALRTDIEGELKKSYEKKFAKEKKLLEEKTKAIEEREKSSSAEFEKRLKSELQKQLPQLQASVKSEMMAQLEADKIAIQQREKESESYRKQLQEVLAQKEESDRKVRESELIIQKTISQEREKIREEVEKSAQEAARIKMEEQEQKFKRATAYIEELEHKSKEMQRKLEQGSQQQQGETLELNVEESLKAKFSDDQINPVAKGVKGADLIQSVYSRSGAVVGKIVWELKRTGKWSDGWIEKLRDDLLASRGDLAVIVSEVLPKGRNGFFQQDGVWVTTPQYYLELATVLRQQLLGIAQAKLLAVSKGESMDRLYEYFSGPTFRQTIESIVRTCVEQKASIESEKRALNKIWAERVSQTEGIIYSLANMYGSLQGIFGESLAKIEMLELKE